MKTRKLIKYCIITLMVLVLMVLFNDPTQSYAATKYRTVRFDSEGGTKVLSKKVPNKKLVSAPKTPKKTGYTFKGWYKDTALKKVWNFKSSRVTSNITLHAKWVINTYKVSFNSKGGSTVPKQTIRYKYLVKAPKKPVKKGYSFVGWYQDSQYKKLWKFPSQRITKTTTLYAKWSVNNIFFKVKFNTDGGSPIADVTVKNNALLNVPVTKKEGYTFSGWYKDSGLKIQLSAKDKVTSNITLYAKWILNTYTVSFDCKGGSEIKSQLVGYRKLLVVPAIPSKEGYTFSGWYATPDLLTMYDCNQAITSDLTLYAKWDIVPATSFAAIIPSNVLSLKVRSSPSCIDDTNIIGTLYKSNVIDVYPCETDDWYQIEYKGQTAYISSKLSGGTVAVQLTAYAVKITAPIAANIYTSPDETSSIVNTLKKGSYANVIPLPNNPNFVKVATTRDKIGYLLVSDIQELFYARLNIHMPSGVTAAQIDAAIANYEIKNNKDSVFHGMGQTFINVGNAAGINPLIMTAMAIHESGWGTSSLAKHKYNIFSVAAYDDSAYDSAYTFTSAEEAIRYQADFLNKSYIESPYSTGKYTMMGDFLGTGGLAGLQNQGESGINAYYATGVTWGAGIANLCEQLFPYHASDYKNVSPMVAKSLNNIVLSPVDNDFSNLISPIIGKNRGSALKIYTTLGGNTTIADSKGNSIYLSKYESGDLSNDGTFRVLHFYGNSMKGWMQISLVYAGVSYTGYVDFGGLSGYSARFTLDNLMRNVTTWEYTAQTTATVPSGYASCYR